MKYIKPEFDRDFSESIPSNLNLLIDQYLTNCNNLSEYIDETELISDQVLVILVDAEDDKLGRIKDLYNKRISKFANFVEDNYEYNKHAAWVFEQAKDW